MSDTPEDITEIREIPVPDGAVIVARSWRITLIEHEGEVVMPVPDEVMQELDLKIGDTMIVQLVHGGLVFSKPETR